MSASSTPAEAPSAASASARLVATVDLPTPPLPEATAMMFLTPGSGLRPPCTACAAISESISTVIDSISDAFQPVAEPLRQRFPPARTGRIAETDLDRHPGSGYGHGAHRLAQRRAGVRILDRSGLVDHGVLQLFGP